MTEPAQTTIRGYAIYEQVGAGAHSLVYRAVHQKSGTVVALKVLMPQLAEQDEFIQRYEGEVESIIRLSEHQHIVKLYDYWRSKKGAFMVLQWLGGGTLADDLQQNGPYSLPDAIALFEKICIGLSAAHKIGIVHRDLKPTNILFDDNGVPYIADFGIAKRNDANITVPGTLLGSPAYLAPEQLLNKPVTSQTDIYSLAINLFETLTGKTPYAGMPTTHAMIKKVREPTPSILKLRDDLPEAVDRVIQNATAIEATQRYPSISDFINALRQSIN